MKLRYLFYLLILLNFRCSDKKRDVDLQIQLIKSEEDSYSNSDIGALTQPVPTSLSNIECVGVFAGYPDGQENKGNCYSNTNEEIPITNLAGLAPYTKGKSSTLIVNALKPKTTKLVLFGFERSDKTIPCAKIDPSFSPDNLNYSEGYILGTTQLNLAAGPNAANITASFNANSYVDKCDDSIFDKEISIYYGLLGFWNFDDTSVTSTSQASYGNVPLTWNGTKNVITGKIGSAIQTDNTDYISTSLNSTFNMTCGGINYKKTFSGWYYLPSSIGTDLVIANTSNGNTGYKIYLDSSTNVGFIKIAIGNGTSITTQNLSVSSILPGASAWKHIAVTINNVSGGAVTTYVNNSAYTTTLTDCAVSSTSSNFNIGGSSSDSVTLDAFGIWNRALNSSEISTLYDGGAGEQYPFD